MNSLESALFDITLYLALAVFLVGLAYKIWVWHRLATTLPGQEISTGQRLAATGRGLAAALLSRKILVVLKVVLLDVLLQARLYKENKYRWAAHMLIFWGFMLLLVFHALQSHVSENLFSDYYSTVNPYLFLRNLFGVMVLIGMAMAIARRLALPSMRATNRPMDAVTMILLAVIMLSGFLLESAKIVSADRFQEMAEEFGGLDGEELTALEAYWQRDYGVIFGTKRDTGDAEMMKLGASLHEDNCAECHSRPQAAFLSHAGAKVLGPVLTGYDGLRLDVLLWNIHFLACFAALAWLPFGKFFHILASPIGLITNAVMDPATADPAALATRRAMEMDACTHCGACSEHCSVKVIHRWLKNRDILPSEKLASFKLLTTGRCNGGMPALREGDDACTRCLRCTKVCPVGINLQDQWFDLDRQLAAKGQNPITARTRQKLTDLGQEWLDAKENPISVTGGDGGGEGLQLTYQKTLFRYCFQCQTCTNACPVVAAHENPGEALGLLPHQVMYSLGMGLVEVAMESKMTWDCTTCYLCQEYCPQQVPVTDLLYELRNMGFSTARKGA